MKINAYHRINLWWLGVCLLGAQAASSEPLPVKAGRQLRSSPSELFQLRALAYSPTPIGICSAADVALDRRFLVRDGAWIRQTGANAIRIYGGVRIAGDGTFTYGVTDDFFTEAARHGLWVIVGSYVAPALDFGSPFVRARVVQAHTNLVDRFKRQPNVLFWAIGNEVDQWVETSQQLAHWHQLVEETARAIKNTQGGSSGPGFGPYVTCVNGAFNSRIPSKALVPADSVAPSLDLWGINIYSGPTFGPLLRDVDRFTTRPFWVAECGIDTFDQRAQAADETSQAEYVVALAEQLYARPDILSGGVLGFYSDEWWKDPTGSCSRQNTGGAAFGGGPDNFLNEEFLGIFAVAPGVGPLDTIRPKAAFAALQSVWLNQCPCTNWANAVPVMSRYDAVNSETNAFNNFGGASYPFFSGASQPIVRCDRAGASGRPGDRALWARHRQNAGTSFGYFGFAETLYPFPLRTNEAVIGVNCSRFDLLTFDAWISTPAATNRWTVRLEDTDVANEWQNVSIALPLLSTNVQTIRVPLRSFLPAGRRIVDIRRVAQIVFQANAPASTSIPQPLVLDIIIDNLRILTQLPPGVPFRADYQQRAGVGGALDRWVIFPADPESDYVAQASGVLPTTNWTTLPGGPNCTGCVLDVAPVDARFYRVARGPLGLGE